MKKPIDQNLLTNNISQKNLPFEFIDRVQNDLVQQSEVYSFTEATSIIDNLCQIDLTQKDNHNSFMDEMRKINAKKPIDTIINLPTVSRITCDYNTKIWFILSLKSRSIDIYDISNTKDNECIDTLHFLTL